MAHGVADGRFNAKIRGVREGDIYTLYSICVHNSIHSVCTHYIYTLHKVDPKTILVVTSDADEVIGLCFCYVKERITIFSGFALLPEYDSCTSIRFKLFETARKLFPNAEIEAVVPQVMNSYMISHKYHKMWDIILFTSTRYLLKPFACYEDTRMVRTEEAACGYPCNVLYYTQSGGRGEISFTQPRKIPIASFKLYDSRGENVIGFGVLNRHIDGHWLIGPLVAPDRVAAQSLLRGIMLYISDTTTTDAIIIYVVSTFDERHIITLMEDVGFKRRQKWEKFSSTEGGYEEYRHMLFAVESVVNTEW